MNGLWRPDSRDRLPFEVKVLAAGLAVAALLFGPIFAFVASRGPDSGEFDETKAQRVVTRIVRIDRPIPSRTMRTLPWLYVEVEGRAQKAAGVTVGVHSNPRVGMPVQVDYRIGRSGEIYVLKVDSARAPWTEYNSK